MSFQSMAVQPQVKKILQNSLRSNRISHAYIFHGPIGSGREKMAEAFLQAVFCENGTDDSCGTCLECRKIEHHNHSDIHWVEAETNTIKIDQIRELQKRLSFRSTSSKLTAYVIKAADRMTIQAANSLLKVLEEPGIPVLAILITENGHALLPTIQSRSQWVAFHPMPAEQIAEQLLKEGIPEKTARPAAMLSAAVETARMLAEEEWFAETRELMLQLAKEALTHFPSAIVAVQQRWNKNGIADHIDTLLDLYMVWCKDMIYLSQNIQDKLAYTDQLLWMEKLKFSRSISFWIHCMETAIELQKNLRFYANPQLVLEKLIYSMQGESFCIP